MRISRLPAVLYGVHGQPMREAPALEKLMLINVTSPVCSSRHIKRWVETFENQDAFLFSSLETSVLRDKGRIVNRVRPHKVPVNCDSA